jgi:hypothetical protein
LPKRQAPLKFLTEEDALGRLVKYRFIGAEIEIAGLRVKQSPTFKALLERLAVNVVDDGSISMHQDCRSGARELVTQPATAGAVWSDMIGDICDQLKAHEARVNSSCGLHIHVDARDLTAFDIKNLVKVYAHIEDVMFSAIAPARRNRHYCKPCGQEYLDRFGALAGKALKTVLPRRQYGLLTKEELTDNVRRSYEGSPVLKQRLRESLKSANDSLRDRQEHKYNDTRYRALNLHSYWHRGTIEFRHHHGTVDAEKIRNWGMVCMSVVDSVATHQTDSDIQRILDMPKGEALLHLVKDNEARRWLIKRIKYFTPRKGCKRRVIKADPAGEV